MNLDVLTEENYFLFCAAHYDNYKYHSTKEFIEDLNRIKYIKKLITRYIEKRELKERLILNHIIILNNCFGPEIVSKIFYLKMKDQMIYVKPFMIFLNILPDIIYNVGDEKIIDTNVIAMDEFIITKLRNSFNGHKKPL